MCIEPSWPSALTQSIACSQAAVREELGDKLQRASELEARLEEVQQKESALRSTNKVTFYFLASLAAVECDVTDS